jgi:uncharacterized membrane protein YoaK (UPF0700 family)
VTEPDPPPRAKSTHPAGIWIELLHDPDHGPLPVVLLALTFVTGLVDAVSILALGRVFVANMTGNVVFVGFAIAGAPGFSLAASLAALGGFVVGAAAAGRMIGAVGSRRPALTRLALSVELAVMIVALAVTASVGTPISHTVRDVVAFDLAIALGVQNAVVRFLKVPDLTTTVLTMTLTGIAADIRSAPRGVLVRRALAVVMMLVGAIVGAILVTHASPADPLAIAAGLTAAALGVVLLRRQSWS